MGQSSQHCISASILNEKARCNLSENNMQSPLRKRPKHTGTGVASGQLKALIAGARQCRQPSVVADHHHHNNNYYSFY